MNLPPLFGEAFKGIHMKLSEVISKSHMGFIVDGTFYKRNDVQFSPSDLEIELEVVTMDDTDSRSLSYGKRVMIAQGTVDGHRFIARME